MKKERNLILIFKKILKGKSKKPSVFLDCITSATQYFFKGIDKCHNGYYNKHKQNFLAL